MQINKDVVDQVDLGAVQIKKDVADQVDLGAVQIKKVKRLICISFNNCNQLSGGRAFWGQCRSSWSLCFAEQEGNYFDIKS